ncbi:MAG: hypothetical protein WBV43_08570 [Pseudolabrys sp.]
MSLTVNEQAVSDRDDVDAQDFGLKSQDRAGRVVQKSEFGVGRECLAPAGPSITTQRRLRSFLTAFARKTRRTGVSEGDSGMTNEEPMNSVTEKKQRRRFILTKTVMAGIPVLVQQGMTTEAIAARLGCKVGTLKVRCSQAQISLRVPREAKVVPLVSLVPASPAEPPQSKRCFAFAVPTTLELSRVAMSRLRQRAEANGMNEAAFITKLLEVIAQDDLFDAVLDNGKGAA